MIEFLPAVSGDGSELVKPLTPTTICSPRSIASIRRVLDSTSFAFSAPVSIALTAPPIASIAAISASASLFSLATSAAISLLPSKMSPNSRRSVS